MRVLVVAGGTMAQAGMAALVESIEGLEVSATVSMTSAAETGSLVDPDVCLVDMEGSDPGDGRLEAMVIDLRCPVVVVCEPDGFGAALANGARGALSPAIPSNALGAALTAALAGVEVVYPPGTRSIPTSEIADDDDSGRAAAPAEPLTARELQVLQLLPAGLTNQQVAGRLGISEHTAKFHVSSVLGKLGAQSRAEAVNRGYQLGLISI